jgi:hypothetical protein
MQTIKGYIKGELPDGRILVYDDRMLLKGVSHDWEEDLGTHNVIKIEIEGENPQHIVGLRFRSKGRMVLEKAIETLRRTSDEESIEKITYDVIEGWGIKDYPLIFHKRTPVDVIEKDNPRYDGLNKVLEEVGM